MATALSNFMWRRGAERVDTEETDDHPLSSAATEEDNSLADGEDGEEGQFVGSTDGDDDQIVPMIEDVPADEEVEEDNTGDIETGNGNRNSNSESSTGATAQQLEDQDGHLADVVLV